MLFSFRTVEDDQIWTVDTEILEWTKASSIVSSPSVKAVESKFANYIPIEKGKLSPIGGGRYRLHPRKPIGKDGRPQLSMIVLLTVLTEQDGGTCVTFLQANVDIKDAQHQEIKKYTCECLPAVGAPARPSPVPMPPITADEKKAQESQLGE